MPIVISEQFDIDRFQSADWNRLKIYAAHVTIWSVDKNRATKMCVRPALFKRDFI